MQMGSEPDHCPEFRQIRVSFPLILCLSLQEYTALDPGDVPVTFNVPCSGSVRNCSGHSTNSENTQ